MIDTAAIVLQARMESTRLPGKSLALVAGRSVLAHCVERLRPSGMRVVVATTTRAADDAVEREGCRIGVEVMRGPDEDVLSRFLMVAEKLSLRELVRATGDNPAVDIDAPLRVLDRRRHQNADCVVEHGLPYGTAVEAISVEALRRSADLTTDPGDREHVTPFIRRDSRFIAISALAPVAVRRRNLRLTVDTPDDLAWVRRVFERAERVAVAGVPVPLTALIAAADRLELAGPSGARRLAAGAR